MRSLYLSSLIHYPFYRHGNQEIQNNGIIFVPMSILRHRFSVETHQSWQILVNYVSS